MVLQTGVAYSRVKTREGCVVTVPNEELRRGVVSGIMLTQTAPPVPVDIARERSRPRRGVVGFALASEEERATCVAT